MNTLSLSPTNTPLLVSIPTACQSLSLGRTKIYQLIGDHKLEAVRVGRVTRITAASIDSYVKSLPRLQAAA